MTMTTTNICRPSAPLGVTDILTKAMVIALEPFLRDRPAAAIPGIGRKRQQDTDAYGWKTAWDFAQADSATLQALFGRGGVELKRELLGEVVSPVTTDSGPPKSIQRARSFRGNENRAAIWAHVLDHLAYTVLKMRRQGLACRGVSVWLRDSAYYGQGESLRLAQPVTNEAQLLPAVQRCFSLLHKPNARYTQTGLSLWNLVPAGGEQFSLFTEPTKLLQDDDLQKVIDGLRERYGKDVVRRGAALAPHSR